MAETLRSYNSDRQLKALQGLRLTAEELKELLLREPTLFEVDKSIAESKITTFCTGCDFFQGEGIPCKIVGSNNQARYAVRNWCGYANIGGKRVDKAV